MKLNDTNEKRKETITSEIDNQNFSNYPILNDSPRIRSNSEFKPSKDYSLHNSKNDPVKFYNINNNYNITLEDIKEEDNEFVERNTKERNDVNNHGYISKNSLILEKLKTNRNTKLKVGSVSKSNLSIINQDQNLNLEDFLNDYNAQDEIRNERKFKKRFSMIGRFSSLAKEKCNELIFNL